MRFAPLVAAFSLAAGLVSFSQLHGQPPSGKSEQDTASETKALAGTWVAERTELFGKSLYQGPTPVKFRFEGTTVTTPGTDKGLGIVRLEPTANPKRMTWITAELKEGRPVPIPGGESMRAVYELKGDTLTIAKGLQSGADFPKSVTPGATDPVLVIRLKREKN